jgi:dUTPase
MPPSKLAYVIADTRIPASPAQGTLFAGLSHRDGLYFPNDQRRDIPTGVVVSIPEGVTIKIRGLHENERNRLNVVPQDLHGPLDSQEIIVTVINNAPSTTKLDEYAKLASIAAYKTAPQLMWLDISPEPAPAAPEPPPSLAALAPVMAAARAANAAAVAK